MHFFWKINKYAFCQLQGNIPPAVTLDQTNCGRTKKSCLLALTETE